MLRQLFVWLFMPSLIVSVVVTDYRVSVLDQQMKSVYQSLANFQAERMAARQTNRRELLGMRQDFNKLDILSRDAGKLPRWPEKK